MANACSPPDVGLGNSSTTIGRGNELHGCHLSRQFPENPILGLSLGGLVEGSFLVENWFGIPGVGQLAFDAFASREYYVIIGLVLLIAVAYVAANMLVDLIYPILAPRIRTT